MDAPFITYDEHTCLWTLERDFTIISRGRRLVIPGGFQFDLASIPRALWSVIAPFELSIAAPVVHDWGYEHAGAIPVGMPSSSGTYPTDVFTRAEVDAFFLDIMRQEGVAWWRRQAAYRAVRLFGGRAWRTQPTPLTTHIRTPQ
jgi:hypothetical protein